MNGSSTESINHSATPTGLDNVSEQQRAHAALQQQYHSKGEQQTAAQGAAQQNPTAAEKKTFAEMKTAKRWLVWKDKKVPYYAIAGTKRYGKTDTEADWQNLCTYEQASDVLDRGDYEGIGFALGYDGRGGNWQGIDLDKVDEKNLQDLALQLPGYVEISPSGKGAHAIGYGQEFRTLGSNMSGVEAYAKGRFFTVTQNTIRDSSITCLASYVENVLASRHSFAANSEKTTINVDAKTVTELRSALSHLYADEYSLWFSIGLSLKCLGTTGRGLWLEWSQTSNKYDAQNASKKWDSFDPANKSYESVFHEAQARGWLNPRSNAAQAHNNSRPPETSSDSLHFQLLGDADLDRLPLPSWMVKGIIPDSGFGLLYGASGSYKSFLALDLLIHITNGKDWFGRRVKAGPAVYIPFEGKGGIPKRVRAWKTAVGRNSESEILTNIRWIDAPMNLRDLQDRNKLICTLQDNGWAGGILCIDTLAQAAGDFEENSSKGMGEMLGVFRDLQTRLGGVVLVIHHSGKDASKGARGHSSLIAAADFCIACSPEPGRFSGSFISEKVKDDEAGVKHSFSMLQVHLGVDVDGDAITSLTVHPPQPEEKSKTVDSADINTEDDDFVHSYMDAEIVKKNYPSKNSLKRQLSSMKASRNITQIRLKDAIERLLSAGKIRVAKEKSPTGNSYLTTAV